MFAFFLGAGIRMLALAGFLYVAFFVPLGNHTLYRHVSRIAETQEARELGNAVEAKVDGLASAVSARFASAGNH